MHGPVVRWPSSSGQAAAGLSPVTSWPLVNQIISRPPASKWRLQEISPLSTDMTGEVAIPSLLCPLSPSLLELPEIWEDRDFSRVHGHRIHPLQIFSPWKRMSVAWRLTIIPPDPRFHLETGIVSSKDFLYRNQGLEGSAIFLWFLNNLQNFHQEFSKLFFFKLQVSFLLVSGVLIPIHFLKKDFRFFYREISPSAPSSNLLIY